MRSAAVYVLKDRVLFHPWQKTTVGLGICSEPYVSEPLDANDRRLGEVLLGTLDASGLTVPHPKSWKGITRPRLEAAGVKSEKAFQTGTLSVTVNWHDDTLCFAPTRNGGASGPEKGFHPLSESSVFVAANAGAEAIGATVRSAIELCR
jgi:hypothetical protein